MLRRLARVQTTPERPTEASRVEEAPIYTFAYDSKAAILLGIKSGRNMTDADNDRLIESLTELFADAGDRVALFVLVIDEGHPPPNARMRQRLAAVRSGAKQYRYAIVTTSVVERGIVTAINWMKPPGDGQKLTTHDTLDSAISWLEAEVDRPLGVCRALNRKAREEARQRTTPRPT